MIELELNGLIKRIRTPVAMDRPHQTLMQENPLSKLPTLRLDDGTILVGSSVICRYLDGIQDMSRLFPAGKFRWAVESRLGLIDQMLEIIVLWRNERDKPADQQRGEWLRSFQQKITTALDHFDRNVDAFASSERTIDQIALGCTLSYLDYRMPEIIWRPKRLPLATWQENFTNWPSANLTRPGFNQIASYG